MLTGRIIEERKNYYLVSTTSGIIRATIKGTLKKNRVHACVGDIVDLSITNQESLEGIISKIQDRSTYLLRPPLANLTQVFFISTFRKPDVDLEALDRFLFSAEVHDIRTILVFNKIDLLSSQEREELELLLGCYQRIGYKTHTTSAQKGIGIEELINLCDNELSAFAGLSGVGKSTLLSCIFPEQTFKIGELSKATGRGAHTTTHSTLLPLKNNGFIADTPGISLVNLPDVSECDVMLNFPELASNIGKCRFNDCVHDEEPGCFIRELVEKGEIAIWRYELYHKICKEVKDRTLKSYTPPQKHPKHWNP